MASNAGERIEHQCHQKMPVVRSRDKLQQMATPAPRFSQVIFCIAAVPPNCAVELPAARQMLPCLTEGSATEPCCPRTETTEETIEEMTDRKAEIRYLREKAQQFRELARTYRTGISPKLNEIARELDDRANALEKDAH